MGLAELAAGALLILAAIRPQGRWLAGLIGLALVAVGVMIVVEMDWTVDELASEPDFGWIPIGAGALALLGAALTPPRRRVVTDVDRVDHDDRSDDGYYRA
jgi:peptidoglycan/LPS O-acetylase OafA/YrhL